MRRWPLSVLQEQFADDLDRLIQTHEVSTPNPKPQTLSPQPQPPILDILIRTLIRTHQISRPPNPKPQTLHPKAKATRNETAWVTKEER